MDAKYVKKYLKENYEISNIKVRNSFTKVKVIILIIKCVYSINSFRVWNEIINN